MNDSEFACCCFLIFYLILAPLGGYASYLMGGDDGLCLFCVAFIMGILPFTRAS